MNWALCLWWVKLVKAWHLPSGWYISLIYFDLRSSFWLRKKDHSAINFSVNHTRECLTSAICIQGCIGHLSSDERQASYVVGNQEHCLLPFSKKESIAIWSMAECKKFCSQWSETMDGQFHFALVLVRDWYFSACEKHLRVQIRINLIWKYTPWLI